VLEIVTPTGIVAVGFDGYRARVRSMGYIPIEISMEPIKNYTSSVMLIEDK